MISLVLKTNKKKESPVDSGSNNNESSMIALLLNFTEKEGMPKLSSAVSYRNGTEIRIVYFGESIKI